MVHDQILEQLKNFQSGQVDRQQLEHWVVSHLQQILDSKDQRVIELANELDALFVREEEGLCSAAEVDQDIAAIYAREASTAWLSPAWSVIVVQSQSEGTIHKRWGEPAVSGSLNTCLQVA